MTANHVKGDRNLQQPNTLGTRSRKGVVDRRTGPGFGRHRASRLYTGPSARPMFEGRRWPRRQFLEKLVKKRMRQVSAGRLRGILDRFQRHPVPKNSVPLKLPDAIRSSLAPSTVKINSHHVSTGPRHAKRQSFSHKTKAFRHVPITYNKDKVDPTNMAPIQDEVQSQNWNAPKPAIEKKPVLIIETQTGDKIIKQEEIVPQPFAKETAGSALISEVHNGVMPQKSTNLQALNVDKAKFTSSVVTSNDSLVHLLNDRQSVIQDKADEAKLKHHLSVLSEIQRNNNMAPTNERLIRMQLEYIDTIQESIIKREVLKLFVKDIVEKSGFLSASDHTSADITQMTSLLELINSISVRPSTPMPLAVEHQSKSLRQRIQSGLNMNLYQQSNKAPEQHSGVSLENLDGLSNYGDRRRSKTDNRTGHVGATAAAPARESFQPNLGRFGY